MVAKGAVNSSNSLPKIRISRLSRTVRALVRLQRKRSKSEVVPLGPTAPTSIRSAPKPIPSRRSLSGIHFIVQRTNGPPKPKPLTFREAFGLVGLPMVLMVLGCIIWTLWLIIMSLAPNAAANFLMNTKYFDGGQFWLIPDEWNTLQVFSVTGLVVVLFLYLYVLLEMVLWRSEKNTVRTKLDKFLSSWEGAATRKPAKSLHENCFRTAASFTWLLYEKWKDFTGIHGKHRKFWNLLLKGHDLVMLTLFLRDLLEAGMPARIVYGFAGLAAMNSLSCVVGIVFNRFTALAEIIVDSLFDFGSTIIYPLTVLNFCSCNFHYDRAVFAINMEILPVGSFERRARMFANPAEIALFRASFDSLRILDYTDLFLRIGMNLAFSYRYKRIVEVLLEIKTQKHIANASVPRKGSAELKPVYFSFSPSTDKSSVPQRPVPRFLAFFFVTYSVGIILATHRAITTSQNVCSSHPECVVFAYRWRDAEFCPCRALVDGDPAPRTYYEWTHPVDGTDTVKALAAAGTLETLQLVNRQLTTLPKELRGCRNLNLLSLINCATEKLPVWAKDFQKLQYLQIEGKVGSENLGDLSPDLFSNMPELRYLQLGIHSRMFKMPPLEGAPRLRSIIYSRLHNVTDLPPLARQVNLERLEFTGCKLLRTIPDLTPVVPLTHFSVFQGGQLCCNGFLGPCDLTNSLCHNATCLDDSGPRATAATLQVFHEFSDAVCQPLAHLSQIPTPETIQMCEGVPFKQCQLPGLVPGTFVVGMCYNHRMQVLTCNPDPDKMKVRRRQIQEGVGEPCNPDVEAWLGCRNTSA